MVVIWRNKLSYICRSEHQWDFFFFKKEKGLIVARKNLIILPQATPHCSSDEEHGEQEKKQLFFEGPTWGARVRGQIDDPTT